MKLHDSIFPLSRINVSHLNNQDWLHIKYFKGDVLVNKKHSHRYTIATSTNRLLTFHHLLIGSF